MVALANSGLPVARIHISQFITDDERTAVVAAVNAQVGYGIDVEKVTKLLVRISERVESVQPFVEFSLKVMQPGIDCHLCAGMIQLVHVCKQKKER